jgi:quinolinate synthase
MGAEKESLIQRIEALKESRDACILAHNFQAREVQSAADFVGGTKEMYAEALNREEEVILVASVYPMAQVVACLLPDRQVISPEKDAGCPMMAMLDLDKVEETRKKNPSAEIVCHVKAPVEAIALSSRCVSFSLGESLRELDDIVFIPDMHIARNISRRIGVEIPSLGGYCPPHVKILPRDLDEMKRKSPGAVVLAHPGCRAEVAAAADVVLESGDMVRYVKDSESDSFIVASEVSVVERLARENPGRRVLPASPRAVCQSMKRITLEKLYWSLEDLAYPVEADQYARRVRERLRKLFKGRPQMAW